MQRMLKQLEIEKLNEWQKWSKEIPFIQFPADWQIRIIPPLTGAIVRFLVNVPGKPDRVSVYLDCYDVLGYFGEPHWEVYPVPTSDGDNNERCAMNDVNTLLELIGRMPEGKNGQFT